MSELYNFLLLTRVLYCVTALAAWGVLGIQGYCTVSLCQLHTWWGVLGIQGYCTMSRSWLHCESWEYKGTVLCHCASCMGSPGSTRVMYCVTALAAWGVLGYKGTVLCHGPGCIHGGESWEYKGTVQCHCPGCIHGGESWEYKGTVLGHCPAALGVLRVQ